MQILALIGFAYLLGSIPNGYVLGKLFGVDVRQIGSGNVGATNVARAVGKWQGVVTLLADAAKGMAPVAIGLWLNLQPGAIAAIAGAAFLGHLYPVFFEFSRRQGSRDRSRGAFDYRTAGDFVVDRCFGCRGFAHPFGVAEFDNRCRRNTACTVDFFSASSHRLAGRFSCRDDRLASPRQHSAVDGWYRATLRRALVFDDHFDPTVLLAPALGVVTRYWRAGAETLR